MVSTLFPESVFFSPLEGKREMWVWVDFGKSASLICPCVLADLSIPNSIIYFFSTCDKINQQTVGGCAILDTTQ